MRKVLLMCFLLTGGLAFSQPESGDIFMPAIESIKRPATTEQAQPSFESVLVSGFKTGNALKVAYYFGDNVDLSIAGKSNLYSKSQAQQILKTFFAENEAEEFKIIHKKSTEAGQYFIGELITLSKSKFRVTVNSKMHEGKKMITALTIEAN